MIRTEPAEAGVVAVVFSLEADPENGSVSVVGEFNQWDPMASPMTARSNDSSVIEAIVRCEAGRRYEFRYLSDTIGWFDDATADELCANPHGGSNSVIYVPTSAEVDLRVIDLAESESPTVNG